LPVRGSPWWSIDRLSPCSPPRLRTCGDDTGQHGWPPQAPARPGRGWGGVGARGWGGVLLPLQRSWAALVAARCPAGRGCSMGRGQSGRR
jgi:hypothetical protein